VSGFSLKILRYAIAVYWDKPGLKEHSWLWILADITKQPYNFTAAGDIVPDTGPDLITTYLSALYYTMSSLTTCGFGNIAPNTAAEKFFGCVTMLLGCKSPLFFFYKNFYYQNGSKKLRCVQYFIVFRPAQCMYIFVTIIKTTQL